MTNHHVVAGARQALCVIGVDGRVHAARVRQASRQLDLALLDVPGAAFVPAPIGRSAASGWASWFSRSVTRGDTRGSSPSAS